MSARTLQEAVLELTSVINIRREQTGISNLYAGLVDEHGTAVYRFCRSLTYSKEDAEDLFQETFLRVYEQLPKISELDNPKSFLLSVSFFTWKSWKRKYARRKRIAPSEPIELFREKPADNLADPETRFIEREEIRAVRVLADALPDNLKVPLILYYSAELGIAEIASSLKLPEGTVKSRLHKARKLIKKGWAEVYG